MTASKPIIKINLPGGIIAAGEFLDIIKLAREAGITEIRIGNRQEMLLESPTADIEYFKTELNYYGIPFEVDTFHSPNIMSSYITEDILFSNNWLKEGVYKDILDLFQHTPKMEINLVNHAQTFIPFFTGKLNFISSQKSNFWYLFIRFSPSNTLYCWPSLIFSEDIPRLSEFIENELFGKSSLDAVNIQKWEGMEPMEIGNYLHKIISTKNVLLEPYSEPLSIPDFYLPYYEGFTTYGNQKLWLGIYRRDETFPINFLEEIGTLCLETRVGQLYTTPWKSLVIKGIEYQDRNAWGNILNRFRINVRHASCELNWNVEDICPEGLQRKQEWARELEETDTRTYRLSFSVQTRPTSVSFGSIIIRKQEKSPLSGEAYEILYHTNFNPNSTEILVFKQNLNRKKVVKHLINLCHQFYEWQGEKESQKKISPTPSFSDLKPELKPIFQCKSCLSRYDKTLGDEINGIEPGTDFESILQYTCSVCGGPKEDFLRFESANPIHASS